MAPALYYARHLSAPRVQGKTHGPKGRYCPGANTPSFRHHHVYFAPIRPTYW